MPRLDFSTATLSARVPTRSRPFLKNRDVDGDNEEKSEHPEPTLQPINLKRPVFSSSAPSLEDTFVEPKRFADSDTFGATNAIFESILRENAKVAASHLPGMRRAFGVSFGPNGQLVIPNRDGTVQIQLLSSGGVTNDKLETGLAIHLATLKVADLQSASPESASKTLDHPLEERISLHQRDSEKSKSLKSKIVWKLVDAIWGKSSRDGYSDDNASILERMRFSQEQIQTSRTESFDRWLRFCLESEQKTGLLAGNGVEECKSLGQSLSINAARAATLAALGPGIGLHESSALAMQTSKQYENLSSLLVGSNIRSIARKFGEEWISVFALRFWFREHALQPLPYVLKDVDGDFELAQPNDGVFHLLRFAAKPSSRRLAAALMRLRDDTSDWSMAFHVGRVLLDGGLDAGLSKRKQLLLTMSFCWQLERLGLWYWAVFLCAKTFLLSDDMRKRAALALLCRHPTRNTKIIRFLVDEAGIARSDISYAQALWTLYDQTAFEQPSELYSTAAEHFLLAGSVNDHSDWVHVFASHVGPRLILMNNSTELFANIIDQCGFDVERDPPRAHLAMAFYWFHIQLDFVKLTKKSDDELVESIQPFMESLASVPLKTFLLVPMATAVVQKMSDWCARCVEELFLKRLCSREVLRRVLYMPLSNDERRLFMVRNLTYLEDGHLM
jgi:hypothetical protein